MYAKKEEIGKLSYKKNNFFFQKKNYSFLIEMTLILFLHL